MASRKNAAKRNGGYVKMDMFSDGDVRREKSKSKNNNGRYIPSNGRFDKEEYRLHKQRKNGRRATDWKLEKTNDKRRR